MAEHSERDRCNRDSTERQCKECKEKIKCEASKAGDKAKKTGETVGEKIKNTDFNEVCEKCKEKAKGALDKTKEVVKGVKDKFKDKAPEHK